MATKAKKPRRTETTTAGVSSTDRIPDGMSERRNGSKLAAHVADQIVGDIARRGWPVGEIIGSEAELLERHRVSRAVFREAARLLEHLHVARMRRGPGGGLMVTAPNVDSVTDAVSVYLYYVRAEVDEVFEARLALEEVAVELASERLEEDDISTFRALVDREVNGDVQDHRELHNLVASITANPALAFFVDLLNRVTRLYLPSGTLVTKATVAESAAAHAAIVESILRGDSARARARMRKHLQAESKFLSRQRSSRDGLLDLSTVGGRSDKLAEQTARHILRDVAAAGWRVGDPLGSEADVMERYDVSRAVLREAVRVLEHHQVARMRRGAGGGFFIAAPGIEAVTDAVALQVDRLGIEPRHLFEVRVAVEMVVLDLATANLDADADAAARLEAALKAERSATRSEMTVVAHDLHAVLASVAGNRVMELLVLVLVRLTRFHATAPPDADDRVPSEAIRQVHHDIVQAVLAGDRDLARHRMRRHLDLLERWVK